MTHRKAQFITLEGVEGAGKSTQKEALCRLLEANNIAYIETREPGGTPYAESIRELLLNHSDEAPCAKTAFGAQDSSCALEGSLGGL